MSRLMSDADVFTAYTELRSRVTDLLRTVPEERGDENVPTCPGWTVRELASHMVGVCGDILEGRMEGVATDAWTQAQVERLRGKSLSELADVFESSADAFDAVLPMVPPPANSQLVMDAVTHEHDFRNAVGMPGARDSLAVRVALAWLLDNIAVRSPGLDDRVAAADVNDFDKMRSLSGRRSGAQIQELGLDSDALVLALEGTPLSIPATSADG